MLEFLIDNIFVSFGGTLFQQVVGIPMGTNCAPLLADLFLYSYESEFLQKLVKDKKIHEARAFNFTYRYIDDVLSINNSRFAEFLPLIYPPELEVKETTDTASSASFLDVYLEFDHSGQLSTKIYDKRDDFNFKIINFPNMCSNIPASPAYGVYISQLIRYARASSNYSDFLKRHLHLRNRLLDQGYKKIRLIRSLKKFIFRYQYLSKYIPSLQKKILAMHFHIVKMYKDKEVTNVKNFFVNVWRKNIFDIYVTEYGTALTTIIPILFLYLNTVTVTAGTFQP